MAVRVVVVDGAAVHALLLRLGAVVVIVHGAAAGGHDLGHRENGGETNLVTIN